jgi:hypothetical protein
MHPTFEESLFPGQINSKVSKGKENYFKERFSSSSVIFHFLISLGISLKYAKI